MIRVIYNSDEVENFSTFKQAQFKVMTKIFESRGKIMPIKVTEIMGYTSKGVPVEREIHIVTGLPNEIS